MSQEGLIQKCVAMKQIPTEMKLLRKGELFRVLTTTKDQSTEWSAWQVALTDAKEDEKTGGVYLESDTIHLIMGRPEVVGVTVKEGNHILREPAREEVPTANLNPESH